MNISNLIELWDSILFCVYNVFVKIRYLLVYPCIKKELNRNRVLRTLNTDRCFVVMNGPSLKEHNLEKLENEVVLTSNYFFRSDLAQKIKPNYHCWLDSKAIQADKTHELEQEICNKIPQAKILYNYKAYYKEHPQEIYYTYNKHIPNRFGVKTNLSGLFSNFSTVAFYAIACAIDMGFKRIYVLGLDFPPGAFKHFDSSLGETADPKKKEKKEDVCGNYWAYTKAHYESYKLNEYASKKGIQIINLNKNSCIRAFAFDDYETII